MSNTPRDHRPASTDASIGHVLSDESPRRRRRRRSGAASASSKTEAKQPDSGSRTILAGLALAALLALTLLGPIMTFDATGPDGGTSLLRQAGYLAIAIFAALALEVEKDPKRLLIMTWPVVLALAWCWLSLTWAIEPFVAFRRIMLTTIVVFSAFALVQKLGYESTTAIIRWSLVIVLLVNYLTIYFSPELGIHQVEVAGDEGLTGDWRGLMAHKNAAGLVSALTVLYFTFNAQAVPKLVRIGVIAAGGVFLAFSSSKTSVGVCMAALVIGGLFLVYRFRYRAAAFAVLFGLTAAVAVVQNIYSDPFLRTIDDPEAFTGRTVIWASLWSYYNNNPLFGAGFGSFWNIGPAGPIYQYGRDWLLDVTQGHNGYLDLLVQIGPLGVGLVVFATIVVPLLQLLNSRNTQGQSGALFIATLIFLIGHNMTESSVFDRDSIGNVFWMLTLALLWTKVHVKSRSLRSSSNLLSWANQSEDAPSGRTGKPRRAR